MISVQNLTHQLGQQTILNELSLIIPKGKVTALVGANGAGKSTLLSLIARLMKLQKGQIVIDNMSVGDTLSGGQRQRAYVAMTYAQNTDYMLLDEPLNNMDIAASRALMRVLRDLCEHHGRTIVIVLHDINYASAYTDNVVALAEGKIDQQGTPLDVVTSAFLQRIYGTAAKVHILDNRPFVQV
ncbi:ATP-binding cassette domain-containing protein [Maritalea myrionectae]|uniref:ATP-binding cassette domain-containing protein n=1 Tax=Maritalea myrionectae TaxID=454601 RepID=UPI00041BD280|nr:ATP-binding cassette domain-containing protein [Maritalea myrionectae]